jgi:hypothetical protein
MHREELAFGERVAATLARGNQPRGLDVLRIPEGISGRQPRADQRYPASSCSIGRSIGRFESSSGGTGC